jgi:L-fucose mutarotase/ribose pyranase (RbsD/FucU family)
MDYLEKRVTIRMPNDIYERVVSVGKVSDVIRDALSFYFASKEAKQDNVSKDISNEAVLKIEDGEKPQIQYIKNASYYKKLKDYKEITNAP